MSYTSHCAGGLLLSILATTSTILDHYLRRINEGFAIGFTSVLIIVSLFLPDLHIIFLQPCIYQAFVWYNVCQVSIPCVLFRYYPFGNF